MSRIGGSLLLHGEVLTIDEVLSRIAAPTLDEIGALASRVLGGERVMAVVGPFAESDFAGVA